MIALPICAGDLILASNSINSVCCILRDSDDYLRCVIDTFDPSGPDASIVAS